MEKEEIQELIRATITEMLQELPPDDPKPEGDPPPEDPKPEDQKSEEKPDELKSLKDEIKQLRAAIHHANFINAGRTDPPKPEKTVEDIFSELINPKKKE